MKNLIDVNRKTGLIQSKKIYFLSTKAVKFNKLYEDSFS